jgi:dihydroorotate dehydrogenase
VYRLLRPFLFWIDPERTHRLGLRAAGLGARFPRLAQALFASGDDRLAQEALGLTFPNPLGLAPGFDKSADQLAAWPTLGFGFVEIGSVTARASGGNPRPRAFRLPDDRALINRMGLNNAGAEAVAARLAALEQRPIPLGINVAKTHDPELVGEAALDDFAEAVARLAPLADYLALNVSCPNTAEGKTFEDPAALDALLARVMPLVASGEKEVPVLVKVSPPGVGPGGLMDFGALTEVVETALRHGASGFIATNTASDRINLATDPVRLARIGAGGVSGAPLAERALETTRRIYDLTDGRVPVVGVGGIETADDAYARIRAGASLLQTYTALVYYGPGVVRRILRGLTRHLEADGFERLADAVGADARA